VEDGGEDMGAGQNATFEVDVVVRGWKFPAKCQKVICAKNKPR
jgi:hypothetical protein